MFAFFNSEYIKILSTVVMINIRLEKYFSPSSHQERSLRGKCDRIAGLPYEVYLFPWESHPNGEVALSTFLNSE